MNEIITSFLSYLKTRAKTQLFGIFGAWWIVFHWNYLVALLTLDQGLVLNKTGLLKNEYLSHEYENYESLEFWIRFVAPFIMTALTIRVLPKILINPAYNQEKKNEFERQKIKLGYEKRLEELRTSLQSQKVKTLEEEKRSLREEDKIRQTTKSIFELEYEEFRATKFYDKFSSLIDGLYHNGGWVTASDIVNKDLLAFADANGLIDYDRNDGEGQITPTEKGKYFIQRYQKEQFSK